MVGAQPKDVQDLVRHCRRVKSVNRDCGCTATTDISALFLKPMGKVRRCSDHHAARNPDAPGSICCGCAKIRCNAYPSPL